MSRRLHLYLLLVTLATTECAAVGQRAQINHVEVSTHEHEVLIEVDLTMAIIPSVTFARNPDRVIADFPNTIAPKEFPRHIPVGKNGIERVRIGLNQVRPPITRVIVDLDMMRPLKIDTSGSKVLLSILPAAVGSEARESAAATSTDAPNAIKGQPPKPSPANAAGRTASVPAVDAASALAPRPLHRAFKVKGIASGAVYIDGGSNTGLRRGMKLIVRELVPPCSDLASCGVFVAELKITATATSSAVAEIHAAKRQLKRGDRAFLKPEDEQAARMTAAGNALPRAQMKPLPTLLSNQQHPQRFAGDSRGWVTSQIRARIGMDFSGITSGGSTPGTTTQTGLSIESDMTNLFGTHWNLQGYWRGNINRHSQFQEPTIEETLNKTYTMQLYYDNPDSPWVAAVGRLYLPWAVSLDTIDGGYLGRKLGGGATLVAFAGSTPDLTSWHYAPNHRIAGSFVNFSGGDYDGFHFSSTSGLGLSTLDWKLDRPFLFAENEVSYKNLFSVYHSVDADSPRGVTTHGIRPGAGISHSYFTVHFHPTHRLSFDIYHNYFRDVPTAAVQLVGLGRSDTLLFQGLSAGVHFEPFSHVILYTTLGRSKDTGDQHRSLSQMYGLTWSEIAHTGIRADFHYSKFDSNFARGDYRLLSISRQITKLTFFNVMLGDQNLISPFTTNDRSKFAATSLDLNLGKHSFIQSGYTFVNGSSLNYRQWYFTLGFRWAPNSPYAGTPTAIPGH